MNRTHIMALICLTSASLCSGAQVIEYNPSELTRLIEAGKALSEAATVFTETIDKTSPNILKIIGASRKTAETLLAQTDTSLARHVVCLERMIDKYTVRSGTVLAGTCSLYLAYQSSQSFATYKGANTEALQTKYFWRTLAQGFFSALSLGVATYLYLYKWDAHLTILPSLISTVAPIAPLS